MPTEHSELLPVVSDACYRKEYFYVTIAETRKVQFDIVPPTMRKGVVT